MFYRLDKLITALTCAFSALSLISLVCPARAEVFLERKGIVAIEAESTKSRLGDWKKKTDVKGYTGDCHLEFTGNKPENGPAKSPLKYSFKISKPGKYQLTLRARKHLESKRQDISNDCYVALKGDFESGGKAPLKTLRADTKMFGGKADGWGWTQNLDSNHKKFPAIYKLKAGETYELTISGRSKNFNIDRILLTHESVDLRKAQNGDLAESKRGGTSSLLDRSKPVTRKLTNKKGETVIAKLISKSDDGVTVEIRGKRHEIPLSSLSEPDQEFLSEWEPAAD